MKIEGTPPGRPGAGKNPLFAAIADVGGIMNILNLAPIPTLDGRRVHEALTSTERKLCTAAFVAAWLATGDGLAAIAAVVALVRAFESRAPKSSDGATSRAVLAVIAGLTAVAWAARPR